MNKALAAVVALAVAVGCGDDSASADGEGSACGDVTGTWVMNYARDTEAPGNCPIESSTPDVITINSKGSGSAEMFFQGIVGSCSARVDNCKLTTVCNKTYKADGGKGALLATVTEQYSMSFTADAFTGFMGGAISPTTEGVSAGVPQCTANFNITGKRK